MHRTLFPIAASTILCAASFHSIPVLANGADLAATCAPPPMTMVQQRIVDKASEGVDSLRRYIDITRGIHALYMPDVVAWLDSRRAAQSRCLAQAGTEAGSTAQR